MTKKMILLNASPRKNKNTAQMLESVMKGAQEAGAECELIHLTSLNYKGCVSCFACKRTGNTCGGLCIQKDDLRPVLEKIKCWCWQVNLLLKSSERTNSMKW